jgi:hypothetical protein
MKSLNVEILMGHHIGLANSYYKLSQQELLEDYLKSISRRCLNRTIIGLKEKTVDSPVERIICLNRTIIGLKVVIDEQGNEPDPELPICEFELYYYRIEKLTNGNFQLKYELVVKGMIS